MDEIGLWNINEKGADKMSIKMKLPNGSVIEGTAEELAELNEFINGKEQAEEETFSKPVQVGDTIRITDAYLTGGEYEDGDVLTVEEVDVDGDVIATNKTSRMIILSKEFEIIARPQRQPRPDTNKPDEGDIVVITENTNISRNDIGDIGMVGDVLGTVAIVNVPGKPHSPDVRGNYTYFDEMRPATDGEKAKYYRDLAFAKAGREVGDIRKGDVVEGERRIGTGTSIGIVEDIDNVEGVFGIIPRKDAYHSVENVTLIAPVERRVDNHEEDSDTHA